MQEHKRQTAWAGWAIQPQKFTISAYYALVALVTETNMYEMSPCLIPRLSKVKH